MRYKFSHSSHKKVITLFIFFYLTYAICFLLFIIKPSLFYYRAWEYFDEIGYHIPNKSEWKGYESGDCARRFIYSFQKHWATIVSTDEEGYRAVPFPSDQFPLVILGDSHTWGSGLSDEETIPWQVALHLNIPTFNGGRLPFQLSKMIHNPRIKNSKIIVELVAQHLLGKDIFAKDNDFEKQRYEIYACEKNWKNIFNVHPKRFFFPLKFLRYLNIRTIGRQITRGRFDNSIIPFDKKFTHVLKESHFNCAVQNICSRSKQLQKMGYQYVIGLVPSKVLQLTYHFDQKDLDQELRLAEALKQNHVDYIDFCAIFRKQDPRPLFIPTDSHISPSGAKLIAETITQHLTTHYPNILNDCKSAANQKEVQHHSKSPSDLIILDGECDVKCGSTT